MHIQILVGKPDEKRPCGRPWHRLEENIKSHLGEVKLWQCELD